MATDNNVDMEGLYEAASEGMSETMKQWQESVSDPILNPWLGPSSKESELIGATAMAPALAVSEVARSVSNWKRFEDSPNIRGTLKFAGDIGGLLALGRMYKGSNAEATAKVKSVVKKASEIKQKTEAVEQLPTDDPIREKVLTK